MRICFVSRGTLGEYLETRKGGGDGEEKDLIVFGFNGAGEVSYERELKGETDFFEQTAKLSKSEESLVVCGCITDARGHKRKSVVVAENGKLIGVSDMLNVIDGATGSGAALRVYETKIGRMGVVVAEDLYFPEVIKSLALCGSDFIVCAFDRAEGVETALLKSHAFCYGVPILFCAKGFALVTDISGEVAFASPQSPISLPFAVKKEYHLVETRRRGFYKRNRAGMR